MRIKRSLDPAQIQQQRANCSGALDEAQVSKMVRLGAQPSLSDTDAPTQEQATAALPLQHCLNSGATPAPQPLAARPRRAAAQAAGARISRCAAAEARHGTPSGREEDSSAGTSHGRNSSGADSDGSSGSDPDASGYGGEEDEGEDEGGGTPEPRQQRRAAPAAAASPQDGGSSAGREGALWQTVRGPFN
jgi:hypothetical protein